MSSNKRFDRPVRIGLGGPVGSGKTMLALRLCEALRDDYSLAVITNDIYTLEDEQFLVKNGALGAERIVGVETGGCPHTAIRDDTTMNNQAIAQMEERHDGLEVILVESGGDKIPRKGGPAIRFSDLMIVNKTDLAPHVGADLGVMERDAKKMRGDRPTLFCDLKSHKGLDDVVGWIKRECLFEAT